MRPFVISTILACLLATGPAATADGPRGHTLGADAARLAPGAADPMDRHAADADAAVAADAGGCPGAAAGVCSAADAALDR